MYRRVLMRQQIALLLHGIRAFYGLLLMAVGFIGLAHPHSVLAQVVAHGGLAGKVVLLGMLGAAVLLVFDTVAMGLWDMVNSDRAQHYCRNNVCITAQNIQLARSSLMRLCTWANRRRHWFYLPPAMCCLFVIPMSYWLGIEEAMAVRWFYLCLFCGGVAFAIIEGLISNERARYAQ